MPYPLTGTPRTATATAVLGGTRAMQTTTATLTLQWGSKLRHSSATFGNWAVRTAAALAFLPPTGVGPTTGQLWPRTRQG